MSSKIETLALLCEESRESIRKIEDGRDKIISFAADAIIERLESLHSDDTRELSFDTWLSSQFEYDYSYVFNVMEKDTVLNNTFLTLDDATINAQDKSSLRRELSYKINSRLKQRGNRFGIDKVFGGLIRI